jgi:zinc transport system substrate-binding protein
MIRYCRNLAPILSEHFPQRAPAIEANLSKMTQAMERLHRDIDQLLTPHRGKGFMVFHPAWGYFARDYGLLQWAIEDEGKSPSPKHLKAMTDEARKRGIDRIFIQNQFERRNAEALAEALGIRVVELDPLLEDWPAMMMQTARSIVEGFKTP